MSNLAAAQTIWHAWESADLATLESMLADDFIMRGPMPQPVNKAQFLEVCRACLTAFPDWKYNTTDIHENGDTLTWISHISGTHTGPLAVIPDAPVVAPTGKHLQMPAEPGIFTFQAGKLISHEVEEVPGGGGLGIYAQVGVPLIPPQ